MNFYKINISLTFIVEKYKSAKNGTGIYTNIPEIRVYIDYILYMSIDYIHNIYILICTYM
jgi:hypothetical protein